MQIVFLWDVITEHTNRGVEEGEISNLGHVTEQSLLWAAGFSSAGELWQTVEHASKFSH